MTCLTLRNCVALCYSLVYNVANENLKRYLIYRIFRELIVKISKVLVLLILSVVTVLANASSAFSDGCFIPRYSVDITEPAQKAIIVYENNRENLILQVKYDGNVSDFAWVVPVPSYPVRAVVRKLLK